MRALCALGQLIRINPDLLKFSVTMLEYTTLVLCVVLCERSLLLPSADLCAQLSNVEGVIPSVPQRSTQYLSC